MAEPAAPRRKNPLVKTREPLLPPAARSRTAHGLTAAAAEGRLALQRCEECQAFSYPPRDACPRCLSSRLPFVDAPDEGVLVSETTIRMSSDSYFRERTPWRQGLVASDCGLQIITHLHADCAEGERVRLSLYIDKAGQPVFFAIPVRGSVSMQADPQGRELVADPKRRRILLTDGRSPITLALTTALKQAGAAHIFVGVAEPWKPFGDFEKLSAIEGVEIAPLDVTDERSVEELAADIGAKVDILIDTTDYTRPVNLFEKGAARKMSEALNITLLGATRLAQAFGPILKSRGADGATAWVNVLSIYALASPPAFGALGVSQAACLSLSHWLRTELRGGGVRLLNAFSGPLETEWFQSVPPPKVAPAQLAQAIVEGLRRGCEEIYVGDVAKDIRDRLSANPKALEREIGL